MFFLFTLPVSVLSLHGAGLTRVIENAAVDIDLMFTTTVSIGSSAQEVQVQVDTGSSVLWVAGGCSTCSAATQQSMLSSLPSGERFGVTYSSAAVACTRTQDSVSLAGLTSSQSFGVCDQQYNMLYPASLGILGLGMDNTFIPSLYTAGLIDEPVFALDPRGSLTIGSYESDLLWLPGLSDEHWAVSLDAVLVNGRAVQTKNGQSMIAILDSGTTFITGPPAAVQQLYSQIPGATSNNGVYTFPCSSALSIAFRFDGVTFNIPASNLVSGHQNGQCIGSITANIIAVERSKAVSWLVGAAFLKSVYSAYDMASNRVGLKAVSPTGPTTTIDVSMVTQVATGTFTGVPSTHTAAVVTQQTFTVLSAPTPVVPIIAQATGVVFTTQQAIKAVVLSTSAGVSTAAQTSSMLAAVIPTTTASSTVAMPTITMSQNIPISTLSVSIKPITSSIASSSSTFVTSASSISSTATSAPIAPQNASIPQSSSASRIGVSITVLMLIALLL